MSKNSKLKPLRKIVRDFSSGEFIIVRDFSRMNETKCNRSGFLSRHSRSILNRPCCLERMSHSDVLTYKGIPRRFFVSPLREHRTASLLLPSDFEASFGVCSPCDALTQRKREREREILSLFFLPYSRIFQRRLFVAPSHSYTTRLILHRRQRALHARFHSIITSLRPICRLLALDSIMWIDENSPTL